ncbi:hypothetical protein [Fluviicola taffensis]|uniref:Uncharacterized protein n=1 Tax=Fluviicola taffensis (strain DSM 16823 / NCIMB 13979 / RW262) TaxID=755732 RepID=F2IE12_FLUTR|nr:hypothetical protein [Fluviicola taffensis]AEA45576.1 hypothetical protein Fluta_3607 [Fluviicola taffensis DSM 16823]
MIKSRQELFSMNSHFAKFILSLQKNYLPELYEEGDRLLLDIDDEEATVLTKELTEELNAEQLNDFETNRDKFSFSESIELNFIETGLFISSKKKTSDYFSDVSGLIDQIRQKLQEKHVIILGDWNTPWLSQQNDYLPVKNALTYLSTKIDHSFDGGFLLKEQEVIEFMPHLFWQIRCNTALPLIYLTFPNSKTFISICQYSVLHFQFYSENEKTTILEILSEWKFKEVQECNSPIDFSDYLHQPK